MNTGFFKKCLILLIGLLAPFTSQPIRAETKHFESYLNTTYSVNEDGSTYVEHNFQIKNLTPTFFVNKYGLQLSSGNIADVRVTNGNQAIDAEVVNTDNKTTVGITFPDKVVGEGKIRRFTISYKNEDISQVSGQVLEVSIPKLNDPTAYDKYGVTLITPLKFGYPNRVTPESFTQQIAGNKVELHFSNLAGQSISAIYGEKQIFELKLRYILENDRNQPVISQITLPPDTSFQTVHYQTIEPKPQKIELDNDGNWIATYQLNNNSQVEIKAQAKVMLTLDQNKEIPVFLPTGNHLKTKEYWPVKNPDIITLATQNPTAEDIYNFTSTTLSYTTEPLSIDLKRLGAQAAIENPSKSTCQEFTDVFITLARANDIPARRATGFAYSENEKLRPLSLPGDVLHAWPEFFDQEKKVWRPIDPTWGNTAGGVDYFNQFDLNHIVFAFNGESSERPYPAGSYLQSETPQKNVEVTFAKDFPETQTKILATLKPQKIGFIDFPGTYRLELENATGRAWYNLNVSYRTDDPETLISTQENRQLILLPYQKIEVPFRVYNRSLSSSFDKQIQIIVEVGKKDSLTHDFQVNSIPEFNSLNQYKVLFSLLVSGSIIGALTTGSLLVFRRRKQNSLRGKSQKTEEST
ncbi:MAG: transglutaminase-like domain-containing protein [Patescibacteria group bacterium]